MFRDLLFFLIYWSQKSDGYLTGLRFSWIILHSASLHSVATTVVTTKCSSKLCFEMVNECE